MATTTVVEQSNMESIPLQTITTQPASSENNDAARRDFEFSRTELEELSESQEETHTVSEPGSMPANASCETREIPSSKTISVDKWQIRLNATQVVLGIVAV